MEKRTLTLSLVIVAMGLGGCATKAFLVHEDRTAATGIEAGDGISIILGEHKACVQLVEECPAWVLSEGDEQQFESCLAEAMRAERPELAIVPANEFRQAAFPKFGFQDSPHSIEALMPLLKDAEHRQRMASMRLRYVVILKILTERMNSKWSFFAFVPTWGFSRGEERYSTLTAEILDLKEARISGKLQVNASGRTGFVVPVFLVIPLPPVPIFAMTETKACDSLGKVTARFITYNGPASTEPNSLPHPHEDLVN